MNTFMKAFLENILLQCFLAWSCARSYLSFSIFEFMRRAVLIVRVRCVLVQIFFLNVFYLNVYNSFFGWMFRKRTLFGKISQMKLA